MDALTGQELVDQFVAEALESLREVPRLLDCFHQDPTQTEAIHAAFRIVHSIKGTAACLGLDAYKVFVHSLESLLTQVRDGKTSLSHALLELLIEGIDHLEGMLHSAAEGVIIQQLRPAEQAWLARVQQPTPPEISTSDPFQALQAIVDELRHSGLPTAEDLARRMEALVRKILGSQAPEAGERSFTGTPGTASEASQSPSIPEPKEFTLGHYRCGSQDLTDDVHAVARFFQEANSRGVEKSVLAEFLGPFRALAQQLETISRHTEATEPKSVAQDFAGVLSDLQNLYASTIDLDAGLAELLWNRLAPSLLRLRDTDSASDLPGSPPCGPENTAPPNSSPSAFQNAESEGQVSSPQEGQNLRSQGERSELLTQNPDDLPKADPQKLSEALESPDQNNPFGLTPEATPRKPSSPQASSGGNGEAVPTRYVRVKEAYLEEFLEDVSNLFITGELLRELQSRISEASLGRSLAEEFRQTCQDLRIQLGSLHRSAASLRRVSAAEVFGPYPRMARSLALQLKKKVRVLLEGEQMEIDRALARELEAPLTHLVRNAVDHGIERPEERRARQADEIGTILLKAEQTPQGIRISIEDDGRGIDPDRIRRKAVEKGILTPQQAESLSDSEAVHLIFHPGFSTAEQVSEISGRGVGMDVVRAVVEKHRGALQIESLPGKGTKIHMTFPIRKAVLILDGLLIRQRDQLLVIPLEHVREIVELQPDLLHTVQSRSVLHFRGNCYPFLGIDEALQEADGTQQTPMSGPAAIVGPPGKELCLGFDELLGHRQVVVRNLDAILPGCSKTQGVALLGGGRLALVLNIPEILAAHQQCAASF